MPRRKKPRILRYGEMREIAQAAEIRVVEERERMAIEEAQQLHRVRHDCLERLVTSARVTIADVLVPSKEIHGRYTLRRLDNLPTEVARAIKKVRIKDTVDGQIIEVELAHHLEYDALLGKYTGLLSDKHLHLHNHAPPESGQRAPEKLADLTPEQLKAERARLEKEVELLEVRDTPPEEKP
jgi:predicted DNA-binding protein (UPF0251 family)